MVVIVGPPGAGKTTICGSVLPFLRVVDPQLRIVFATSNNVLLDELVAFLLVLLPQH